MARREPPTLRAVAFAVAGELEQAAARLRESTDPRREMDGIIGLVFAGARELNVAWIQGVR